MKTSPTRSNPASSVSDAAAKARVAERLWSDYLAARSPENRNALIMHYLPLVQFTAGRVFFNRGGQVERDDLVQFGTLGLRDAIAHFDPARGIKFETYCARRIHGAMLDGMKTNRWVPRDIKQQLTRLTDSRQRLESELGQCATGGVLAERLGVSQEDLFRLERHQAAASITALEPAGQDDDDASAFHADALADQRERAPLDEAQHRDVRDLLLKGLSPIQRHVIMLYYYEDMTMREIGKALNLSGTRVSQIHSEVVDLLRQRLADRLPQASMTVHF